MEKKSVQIDPDEWLKDLPEQKESPAFKQEEMIPCKKCKRTNPPTRLDCLYCGLELEFDENQSQFLKPILRKTEPSVKGFNLIYLANLLVWDEQQFSEVAKMTRLDRNSLKNIVKSHKCLPIARAERLQETEIVSERLKEIGIETKVIPDVDFIPETIPRRLRGIQFDEERISLFHFNNEQNSVIEKNDLKLIVIGMAVERKLESTEKYKKKGENKVLETSELSSDEVIIDIYRKDDLTGYRISPGGFDFSCLGDDKKLLASENIKILISKLKEFAGNACFDDSYGSLRPSLANVWEVEERNDSKGMERKSFGSYNRISVTTTTNTAQFTKYSRLLWLLKE